jgi:fermentation-respiration switch protein FrsA (DUF1100 family)
MSRAAIRAWCALLPLAMGCVALPSATAPRGKTLDESIIFQPSRFEGWTAPPGAEDVWIESTDGAVLHGWFAPAANPRAVVLFCHGNAGNVVSNLETLTLFRDRLNCTVLVFDYRGYGKSKGTPDEDGVLDDADSARRWLAKRCKVGPDDVVLAGHSLGGGVAVHLAARYGARGLVLWNTFSSLPDVAFNLVHLPVGLLMRTKLDSRAKIGDYHGPLLQTHGDADQVIPYKLGRKLFDAANEPKRFVPIPGGGHNDPPSPQFVAALDEFLGSFGVHDAERAADPSRLEWSSTSKRGGYRADPYIKAAAALQAVGKDRAAVILAELARKAREDKVEELKVVILCRMLFRAKPGGTFRPAAVGKPIPDGPADRRPWPLEPIEVVDGVPFKVVSGYTLTGEWEHAANYLAYCLRECEWNPEPYRPKSAAEKRAALAKLNASLNPTSPLPENDRLVYGWQIE